MTEQDTAEEAPQGESTAARRRWRDDPLSLFLAIAAVILGGMYLLEQRDLGLLQEAGERAQALGATTLNLEGCTVGSASTSGRTLVVACTGTADDTAKAAAARAPDLAAFDRIVFVGNDQQLDCAAGEPSWPTGCDEKPLPTTRTP